MSLYTPNTSSLEQLQRRQPMRNAMIVDDRSPPFPKPGSPPSREPIQVPVPSSIFQRAREVDIGGNPSFVNGNVYHYNHHNHNHATRNLTQTSSIEFTTRRNERRADIIKQLGEEVKELNQLLQEKAEELSRMEDASNRQAAKLKRLEGEVGKLNQLLQEKTAELASLEEAANRAKGRHENEIRILEENVSADMNQQKEKYEEEIRGLQAKVNCEEEIRGLQANLVEDMNQLMAKYEREIRDSRAKIYDQKANGLDQESGIKKDQNKSLPSTSASGNQTNIPPPLAVVPIPKADSVSVTDVANLVKALNDEIGQTVLLLTESLSDLEPPAPKNESEIAFDELRNYLGPWLCDKLRDNSEPDPLIAQLALQTGLANACSSVVNDSPFWYNGSILQTLYRKTAGKEGQVAADEWRAKASKHLDLPRCEDANKKYLTEVLLKVATAAVGGTLKSSESLISQYNQQVEAIAKLAAQLHKTITKEVTSSELITYTVSCDTEFDASQMEDTENNHGSTPRGKVICTHDMGLLWRKRVEPKKPRGSLKDWGVTMKAKVVLAATLEGGKDRKRK